MFRVDANEDVGIGHLIRCIALADVCVELGSSCIFFGAYSKKCCALLQYHKYVCIDSEKQALRYAKQADFVVLDSYHFNAELLAQYNSLAKTLVLDDENNRGYFPANFISNPAANHQ